MTIATAMIGSRQAPDLQGRFPDTVATCIGLLNFMFLNEAATKKPSLRSSSTEPLCYVESGCGQLDAQQYV